MDPDRLPRGVAGPLPRRRATQACYAAPSGICGQNWNKGRDFIEYWQHIASASPSSARDAWAPAWPWPFEPEGPSPRIHRALTRRQGPRFGIAEHSSFEAHAVADIDESSLPEADLYVLAVPDRALPQWPQNSGTASGSGRRTVVARRAVVAHTSGATSVDVLRPCAEAGAATLVFHPLQTFSDPVDRSARFAGAAVGYHALRPRSRSTAEHAASRSPTLSARVPSCSPTTSATLYHAAATVACNYLVTSRAPGQTSLHHWPACPLRRRSPCSCLW